MTGGGSNYETVTVGEPVSDVSLGATSAHCDLLGTEACEVFVRLTDHGTAAATVPVRVDVQGGETVSKSVEVPAGGSAPLVFTATPGAKVKVSVPAGDDGLAADDSAYVSVPEPGGERITLVGQRTRALPLARALASVPGVNLRLRTPQSYEASDPGTSDLLVLDDFIPKGGLPDGAGAAPRPPAELPRRHGPRQDERQPHERHRSGEPAARRGRPRLADDRRRGLAAAGPARRSSAPPPGAPKAR